MKLTLEWLKEKNACADGVAWYEKNGTSTVAGTITKLISAKKWDWANWLLTNAFDKMQCVEYAVFSARSVLKIYEYKYHDLRPRKAIEAAEQYLKTPTDAACGAARAAAGDAAFKETQTKIIMHGLKILEAVE